MAGPHYFVAWRRILDYIDLNQFGENAHVWRMTGGLGFQLAYHVFGYSGQFMMGQDIWILLGLTGIGLVLAILRRNAIPDRCWHFFRLTAFVVWALDLHSMESAHESIFRVGISVRARIDGNGGGSVDDAVGIGFNLSSAVLGDHPVGHHSNNRVAGISLQRLRSTVYQGLRAADSCVRQKFSF